MGIAFNKNARDTQFLLFFSVFLFDDILLRFSQVLRCSDAFLMID